MNSKRFLTRVAVTAAVLLAAAAFPKPATADLSVLNFGFQNLASTFVAGPNETGTFTALSQASILNNPTLGTVTRTTEPNQFAIFNFHVDAPDIGPAAVSLILNLTNINQGTLSAQATGTFLVRDVNGYAISGSASGTWSLQDGFAHFDGTAFDLMFETGLDDPTDPLTRFEGNLFSPGFSMDFSDIEELLGSVVDVSSIPGGGFFDQSWVDGVTGDPLIISSNLDTMLIPAPGAFLLGAMGLGLVGWVKRKFA